MKTWRHGFLYAVCLPWDLLMWGLVLVIRALWGTRLEWENPRENIAIDRSKVPGGPSLTCELKPGSFPVTPGKWPKGWYLKGGRSWGGTTLGHAIFYGPKKRPEKGKPWAPVQVHEHIHVEQYEAAMLRAFVIAVLVAAVGQSIASYWLAGAVWFTGYFQMGAANWTTAWFRGENPYRGSHHEEAAYALDDDYEQELKEKK
jgi:hypothetical protein